MKQKLFVSFSGGKTSAYMSKWLLDSYGHLYDFVFVFANTGQEHPETLIFVNMCDRVFGLNLVWVEAQIVHGARIGTGFKVVDFETASRDGTPFEEMIRKYGLPNKNYPHCTRELKLAPMYAYIASIGWKKGDYKVAVGMRSDEPKRLSKTAERDGIVYPLAHWSPADKQDVNTWWENQSFTLNIEEREGNCVWCWKKSDSKHFRNIGSNPGWYDFPKRMEDTYPSERKMFRMRRSTEDMLTEELFVDVIPPEPKNTDESGGCTESCEAFGNADGVAQ